ncbi:Hypothetical protein KNT65_gp036 [Escherichia phage EcS1]|uniref:Uncharacterized protein n=1 Tax=Escherichia phage EcS1 TaxID=2083276 RepID=A0A2Z5ZCA3_9CAUD|nr:Hypothetical protein KNT65_gp036 [Escherichia phage EcS1]BBC78084.1 Hypothetical protein [Escherichia phage EcS1]
MAKLIVPIFSMRSYETGNYAILKDGNFQLQLHRASPGDIICIPKNNDDEEELRELFPEITFCPVWYKDNAYESRKHFWEENWFVIDSLMDYFDCAHLVTDITGYPGKNEVIYNFNITKDREVERYYIDEFIDLDVLSVNQSLRTFVLNKCQKDTLVAYGADEDKIIVSQRVINPDVMQTFSRNTDPIKFKGVFHPFRISDKCYNFKKVIRTCKGLNLDLYITDPNDTYDASEYNYDKIHLIKLNKKEYYRVLKATPVILYNENPEKVFHPGLAELVYFRCNIHSPYNIPKREDIIIEGDLWLK